MVLATLLTWLATQEWGARHGTRHSALIMYAMVFPFLILTPGWQLRREVPGMVLAILFTWLATQEWGAGHGIRQVL